MNQHANIVIIIMKWIGSYIENVCPDIRIRLAIATPDYNSK